MKKALITIIVLAFLIRLAAVVFGLPVSDVFGDELNHTIIAFKMLEAKSPVLSFADQAYLPPLFSYMLAPIFGLIGLVGVAFDYFKNIADFKTFVILYRDWFLIPGRIISALFGAATVYLIFKFAEKLFNKKIALLASFLLAVDFLHVHESQIGHVWSMIAFFSVLTAYFLYRLHESGQWQWYYWAGAAIALGYAIGQIPIIFYVLFIAVHWLRVRKNKEKFFNKNFVVVSILCFAIVAVFTLLNFYTFYKHFYDLAIAVFKLLGLDQALLPALPWLRPDLVAPFSVFTNWKIILQTLFFSNPSLLIFSALGLLVFLKKWRLAEIKSILLLSFSLGVLLFFSLIFYHFPSRYTMPAIPFLAVFAAYFVFWLAEKPFFQKQQRFWLAVLIIFVAGYSALTSVLYSFKLLKPYTVSQAVSWTYQNVPGSSRVVSDIYLNNNKSSIEFLQKYNMFGWLDIKKKYLLTLQEQNYPRPNYFLIDTNLTDVLALPPAEKTADYALVFFYNQKEQQEKYKTLNVLKGQKEIAAKFYPQEEKTELKSLLNWEIQFSLPALWRANFIGPYVEIYKINKDAQQL